MISISHKKVLVVDDNKLLAYVIEAILQGEGYEVRTAANGDQGYLMYLNFRPDIVLSDIWMPGKSGLEMMERIRSARSEVKTVYMTGEAEPVSLQLEEERKTFNISVLIKPFSRDELTGLIDELCRDEALKATQKIKEHI